MLLARQGYEAEAVESAEEALDLLNRGPEPQVALVDLDLPGMSGSEFLRRISETNPSVKPVLITAADEERVANIARERNVPHLRKPIDFNHLLAMLDETSSLDPRHN
jgi:CheY-like chemotaxis protein